MADPHKVVSPIVHWLINRILVNGPKVGTDWSLAIGTWDGEPCIAKRWDGEPDGKGYPISSGYPVWFIEPYVGAEHKAMLHNKHISETDREFAREFLGWNENYDDEEEN